MKLNFANIPHHMHEGIQGYVDYGWRPGSFLRAILCNNLVDAAGAADINNRDRLLDYADLLYNEIPRAAWGDSETVERWIRVGGLSQYNKE